MSASKRKSGGRVGVAAGSSGGYSVGGGSYEEIALPLKYHEVGLIPSGLVDKLNHNAVYRCKGGELIKFKYLSVWNNSDGSYEVELDTLSKELYGISLAALSQAWGRRLGKISNWWNKVKMEKI